MCSRLVVSTERGKGLRSGPRDAMLADAVPASDRGRAFGVNQSLDHVGAAIGPLVASGCLAGGLSLRTTFAVAAGLGLAAPVLLGFRLREVDRPISPETKPAPGGGITASDRGAPTESDARSAQRKLVLYVAVCGIFALGSSSDAFILIRAGDLGWAPVTLPLLWLGHHVVKSITTAIGGSLSDRVPRVLLVAGGWVAYAGAYAGFALANRPWHVVALLGFYALYHGLAEAPERALVSDLAGPARRGWAFGLYHGVVGLAALPAGLLTGWIWDRAGAGAAFGVGAAVAAAAALMLAGLVAFGPLRSPLRP